MKKIFLFLILFLFPLSVSANGSTEKIYVEFNVQANGDLKVREALILNGEYNGTELNFSYENPYLRTFSGDLKDFEGSSIYNASGIEDFKIYGVKNYPLNFELLYSENKTEFKESTSFAKSGDYGVYEKRGDSYRIYIPSSYKEAILITYTLKDVVVVHNDIAEFAWDVIGSNYPEDINELVVKVNLPQDSEELRVFTHGPLVGENQINNKRQVEARYLNLYTGHAMDIRVVFDKSIVPYATKKSNIDGLNFILEVEKLRAEKANAIRTRARAFNTFLTIHLILTGIGLTLTGLNFYKKHDKEHDSHFKAKYYREFTGDYNVEVIDYLMNKSITPNAMSASIMNLIYQKKITVEKQINGRKEEYLFTKQADSDNTTETYLLNFLFNQVGDGKTFTDKGLHAYAKSTKTYQNFTSSYETWKSSVIASGEQEMFWEKSDSKVKYILLAILNGGIFVAFNYLFNGGIVPDLRLMIMVAMTVIYIIYIAPSRKRTVKGNDHYLKWRAFKNFLNDFGQFQTKDLPEIILWEKYLVYATVFGLAKKVQKAMNVKIKEMNLDQTTMSDFTVYDYMMINNIVNNSVNSAVRAATYTASQVASSSSSSSGGFGGGGSFGGGGFGGGGLGGSGRF